MSEANAQIGVLGLGVMGRNLARNIGERGFRVAVSNRNREVLDAFMAEVGEERFASAATPADLARILERPRRIILMITAGSAVDHALEGLRPHLEPGDIVVDGGNSRYQDTRRRTAVLSEEGLHFVGMGVSGGEEGARRGPSLMPGGSPEAYEQLRPVLEAIAATTDAGPCVTHVGPDGAGHFVKMVHNGIEYGDMQLLAETYDLLSRGAGVETADLAGVYKCWNEGPLESFLVELTARVFEVEDPRSGGFLVDAVLDQAEQKGTGRWTVEAALELGVAVPTLAAAVDARLLSSLKTERMSASTHLLGPEETSVDASSDAFVATVHDALLAAKICAYAQGLALIRRASATYGWSVDMEDVARIWKGGCIIRARLLDNIRAAWAREPELVNLVLDREISATLMRLQPAWRRTVRVAAHTGIPAPALAASLAWFDSYRSARLPQNLTQAQRDAFGAHTYRRTDDPTGAAIHSDW